MLIEAARAAFLPCPCLVAASTLNFFKSSQAFPDDLGSCHRKVKKFPKLSPEIAAQKAASLAVILKYPFLNILNLASF